MGSYASNIQVSRDETRWEAEVKGEISVEGLAHYRSVALKDIKATAKLDGFRPGKAPEDQIVRVYGEPAILRAAAEKAIEQELPEILAKESLPIVEAPRVSTETPEEGKPLPFTARAALAPSITLPDYAAIGKKHRETKEDTSVSDQEHTDALNHLRREKARIDKVETGTEPAKAAEESKALKEDELPALDDAFVQSLGYPDAATFTDLVRKNLAQEKEMRAQEKRRAGILDDLVKDAKISYPASLREYELEDMEGRVSADLARMGQTFEQYLAQIKKTREELRASWEDAADKRAKVRLVLAEIARKEEINPEESIVAHELTHAKEHYKDLSDEQLRPHVLHALRNEMTLRFLETGEKTQLPTHQH